MPIPAPHETPNLEREMPIPASPESRNLERDMLNSSAPESPNLPIPASVESLNLERGTDDSELPEQAADRDGPVTEVLLNVLTQLSIVAMAQTAAEIEETEMPNQQTEAMQQSTEFTPLGRRIYKAAIRDEWDYVSSIFEDDEDKLRAKISYEGETALCVAVGTNRSHRFVEKIVEKIMTTARGVETLRIKNGEYEENALHVAARLGNVKAATVLVSKDPELPQLFSAGNTPLSNAAMGNDVDTLEYLLKVTRNVDD